MLVVLAGENDTAARSLVGLWRTIDAVLMTPRDLSEPGWRYHPGAVEESTFVADGRPHLARDIYGVVTRLASVGEEELVNIVGEDRFYVASEMTALLQAWLTELKRPVLNRPTPICLSGPYWRREKWVHQAAELGMRVRTCRRKSSRNGEPESPIEYPPPFSVTVVGHKCVGQVHPSLAKETVMLARTVGVQLLGVEFSSPDANAEFLGAHVWPNVTEDGVPEAILDCIENYDSIMENSSR